MPSFATLGLHLECVCVYIYIYIPEGPSTQYLRSLVHKATKSMVFGTRVLQYWVLGPSGYNIYTYKTYLGA